MRRLIAAIVFQVYAVALALQQMQIGVRTDEAKYLLNIPYPHPPAARSVFNLLDGWMYQELFWRIVLASLLVQAVWMVLNLSKGMRQQWMSLFLAGSWLLSSAVFLQAGTVMMAPLTALQGLVFLWLFLRAEHSRGYAGLIGLFWLLSLFTAYQAALFAPLVWAVFVRTDEPLYRRILLFSIPPALLTLYSLTNPLALASMLLVSGGSLTVTDRITGLFDIWMTGGTLVFSIVGTAGLLIRPRFALIASFALLCAYIFMSPAAYYGILFTPLFIAGTVLLLRRFSSLPRYTMLLLLSGLVLPMMHTRHADDIRLPTIRDGVLLINGSFGHEWQLASDVPVLRYAEDRLDGATVVACIDLCPELEGRPQWMRSTSVPVEIWLRN